MCTPLVSCLLYIRNIRTLQFSVHIIVFWNILWDLCNMLSRCSTIQNERERQTTTTPGITFTIKTFRVLYSEIFCC